LLLKTKDYFCPTASLTARYINLHSAQYIMSFIRLKKRVNNYYAYLVINKWGKNSSKQKVKSYLGRYYKLKSDINNQNKHLPLYIKKELIFIYLLKNELKSNGFKQKNKYVFINPKGYLIDIKTNDVINKYTKKQICIGLNEGYLCNYTLKNLSKFTIKKDKKETGKNLIKLLLDLGINPDKDLFLAIFNTLINSK